MIQDVMSNSGGRPTDYKEEYCDLIVDFMKNGSSYVEFAAHIGVCRDTIYEWAKKHSEFSDAKKRALAASQSWWEKQARLYMVTSKEDKFSAPTWIFNMKARFGYRDKVEVEHSGNQKIELSYNLDKEPEE